MKETQIRHHKQKSAFETNRRAPLLSRGQGVGTGPRPGPGVPGQGRKARPHPGLLRHCGERRKWEKGEMSPGL